MAINQSGIYMELSTIRLVFFKNLMTLSISSSS